MGHSKAERASLIAQTVKSLLAMRDTWVQSLGWEDPLEEGMATHSSVLSWKIPMDRGAWWATIHGVAKSQTPLSDLAQGRKKVISPDFLDILLSGPPAASGEDCTQMCP